MVQAEAAGVLHRKGWKAASVQKQQHDGRAMKRASTKSGTAQHDTESRNTHRQTTTVRTKQNAGSDVERAVLVGAAAAGLPPCCLERLLVLDVPLGRLPESRHIGLDRVCMRRQLTGDQLEQLQVCCVGVWVRRVSVAQAALGSVIHPPAPPPLDKA